MRDATGIVPELRFLIKCDWQDLATVDDVVSIQDRLETNFVDRKPLCDSQYQVGSVPGLFLWPIRLCCLREISAGSFLRFL